MWFSTGIRWKRGEDDATVAKLIAFLGDSINLAADYTPGGTGAEVMYLKRTFNNFGYYFPSNSKYLNKAFPYDLLNSRLNKDAHPLLLLGIGHKVSIGDEVEEEDPSVHVWVADGSMEKTTIDSDGYTFKSFYIHCVWGFGGANNGYFLYTYNGVIGGKPDELATGDKRYDFEGYVYNKELSAWINYKPSE